MRSSHHKAVTWASSSNRLRSPAIPVIVQPFADTKETWRVHITGSLWREFHSQRSSNGESVSIHDVIVSRASPNQVCSFCVLMPYNILVIVLVYYQTLTRSKFVMYMMLNTADGGSQKQTNKQTKQNKTKQNKQTKQNKNKHDEDIRVTHFTYQPSYHFVGGSWGL